MVVREHADMSYMTESQMTVLWVQASWMRVMQMTFLAQIRAFLSVLMTWK